MTLEHKGSGVRSVVLTAPWAHKFFVTAPTKKLHGRLETVAVDLLDVSDEVTPCLNYCTAESGGLLCDSVGTLTRLTDSNLHTKYRKDGFFPPPSLSSGEPRPRLSLAHH